MATGESGPAAAGAADRRWRKRMATKGKQEGYLLQGGLLAEVREQWNTLEAELGQSTQRYYQQSDQQERQQIAFLERALTESRLREEAMQILNLTRARPRPDIAVRAIRAVGTSEQTLDGRILTSVQNNLPAVINRICECGYLQGHSDSVRSVAFSPDGKTIVSGSSDQTVRLGVSLQVPQPHRLVITATDNGLAIGAKGHRQNRSRMALERLSYGVSLQVPQPSRSRAIRLLFCRWPLAPMARPLSVAVMTRRCGCGTCRETP